MRPLKNGTFCPISASGSNFNPRNIKYIPVVEIFAFLELEQKLPFFKGLSIYSGKAERLSFVDGHLLTCQQLCNMQSFYR
jgi:hypothetical protein